MLIVNYGKLKIKKEIYAASIYEVTDFIHGLHSKGTFLQNIDQS